MRRDLYPLYGLGIQTETNLFQHLTRGARRACATAKPVAMQWLRADSPSPPPPTGEVAHGAVGEWSVTGALAQRVHGGWRELLYRDGAGFLIDQTGSQVWIKQPPEATIEDTATYVVGPVLGFVLRLRGILAMHASAIALDGRCILLTGSAGVGKSTTAAAFARLGYPILTEDIAALADEGDRFTVQSGYPRINLWPAAVELIFGSASALPRICPRHPTWDKCFLDLMQPPHRFQAEPLPLAAIYVLGERTSQRQPGETPVITGLNGPAALITLTANTYANELLDRQMRAQEFETLSRLVEYVPVRKITPCGDPDAGNATIWKLCQSIVEDCHGLPLGAGRHARQGDHAGQGDRARQGDHAGSPLPTTPDD